MHAVLVMLHCACCACHAALRMLLQRSDATAAPSCASQVHIVTFEPSLAAGQLPDTMLTFTSHRADEWKLENEAKKAAEEKAAAAATAAGTAAGGDQEMAEAGGPSSGAGAASGAAAGGAAAGSAAAEAGAAAEPASGSNGGRDKEKEKKRKSPEELACDILLHFAHTARAFGQVGGS